MFSGRSVAGMDSRHFGGLDERDSLIGVGPGFALDMNNWEVDDSGSVQLRDGFTSVYDFGTTTQYMGSYYTTAGDQVFVAVSGNKFWEATEVAGPWTDRTGSVTLSTTTNPWIGTDLQGRFYLANGVDPAITHKYGENAQTLKTASYLDPPANLVVTSTEAPANGTSYAVTAITANGETTISNLVNGNAAVGALSATVYNTLVWDLVVGAQGYKIYRVTTIGKLIAIVGGLTNSIVDNGLTVIPGGPTLTNTAFNTQTTWDGTPIQGFTVLARGRAQRVIAWRDNAVWASSLSNGLDWLSPNDAFQLEVAGGKDNRIRAAAGLYDFMVLWSRTNSFVYTGSTYNDIQQSKILSVGCESPNSILNSGDDLYFWSEFGPNRFSRVQLGQDIESEQGFSTNVQETVQTLSNRSAWDKIVVFNDVHRIRLGWIYPNGTDTTNSKVILYNYNVKSWSRHTLGNIVSAFSDDLRKTYGAFANGKVVQLYQGTTDNGTAIAGTYETGWYDSQSYLNRVSNWLDIITDKRDGNYSFTVSIFHDFATTASSTHTLTQANTDGVASYVSTSLANDHRCYTAGFGKYFKLVFTVTDSTTAPRVLGWRPEMHSRGTR